MNRLVWSATNHGWTNDNVLYHNLSRIEHVLCPCIPPMTLLFYR